MSDFSDRELERAARLKAVDNGLRDEALPTIAAMLRAIPPEAYRHDQDRAPQTSRERGRDR